MTPETGALVVELETRISVAREQLSAAVVASETTAPDVDASVIRAAGVTGHTNLSLLRQLFAETPVHQLERSLKRLVAAGRLEETDETARGLGRGRSPKVYRLAGEASDTERRRK